MGPTPVVQVRLAADQIEYLDSLPGTRSEAIRHCVDFARRGQVTSEIIAAGAAGVGNVPPMPRPTGYRFSVDECEHKFEARGKCLACGRVR